MTRQRPWMPERDTRLIGRSAELTMVRDLLADVRGGLPRAVLVTGTAGMGKSNLLRAVAELAEESGLLVLSAQAAPVERDFAFGVVRQLLEPVLLTVPAECRERLLAGPAVLAERVLGWEGLPGAAERPALDTYAALHGLFRFTANLAATAPLVIAVDDVESTDPPSLRWLAYLRRRLHGLPVLLAMARGAGREVADPVALNDLTTASVPLALTGLAGGDCADLLAAVFGEPVAPEFAAACAAATGGNPYLLGELAHSMYAAGIPPAAEYAAGIPEFSERHLAQLLLPRVHAQPIEVTRLARAVAVLGVAELDLAAAVADLSPAEAAEAARELTGLGIFADGKPLTFAHGLVATALGAEAGPADRETAHARAAAHLHAAAAPAEQIAAHLAATPPGALAGDWITDTLVRAARGAAANGAPDLAVRCLRRALAEPQPTAQRDELRLELALTELQIDPEPGIRRLTQLTGEDLDPVLGARAAHALAQELGEADRHPEAIALLEAAVPRVEPHDPELARQLRLSVLCLQVDDCHVQPDLPARLAGLRGAPGSMRASRFADTMLAFQAAVGGSSAAEADPLALRAWAQRGLAPATGAHAELAERWEFAYLIAALFVLERLDLAEAHCTELLTQARRLGYSLRAAAALGLRAQVRCRRGALAEAETDARAALAVLDELRSGTRSSTIFAVSTLVEILLERGEIAAAADLLHARGLADELPAGWRYNYLLLVRGLLRASMGDLSGGLADLEQCGKRFQDRGVTNRAVLVWRSCAVPLYLLTGQRERAEQLAAEELALARRWGGPGPLGVALRTAALTAPEAERLDLLTESVRLLETSPARAQLARSLAELALHLGARGKTTQAGALFRRALRLAEDCGADVLADAVRRQAAGLTEARRGGEPVDGGELTPHELRIAEQVVRGRTNREIAQGFQVTSRAVEQHLTRIYRKLGIARRSQLAAALLSRNGGQSWVRRAPGGD
ncbi:AAA family ATPase [Crossiella cryophila]|uniref:DNA-binding CsgD family transcriptional regulator n=1 Tax=Crossiella cryophila TaxID=43355 RepID=A0A7W7CIR0_9PSEU|nr:AAA family ATPase [Crossiella cryophila]MBB4681959.1 DNA-binding CsgD family transcriptional regulator [Crossiella cryophila]